LNLTVLPFCVAPKLEPVMVIAEPAVPDVDDSEEITGAGATVNVTPLLAPPVVTTTGPVVAPTGTVATMLVGLQLPIVVAGVPLKVTVLPCIVPKLDPAIVTDWPGVPAFGVSDEIAGSGITVNVTPLLATPATVTATGPVAALAGTVAVMLVAFQLVALAVTPLKLTVLVPCGVPKFDPAMVMDWPG
jgi:hypothetical protein